MEQQKIQNWTANNIWPASSLSIIKNQVKCNFSEPLSAPFWEGKNPHNIEENAPGVQQEQQQKERPTGDKPTKRRKGARFLSRNFQLKNFYDVLFTCEERQKSDVCGWNENVWNPV